jgi:hypothetical protein
MMRISISPTLLGAAALILGAAQGHAAVVSPCDVLASPAAHSDCIWFSTEPSARGPGTVYAFAVLPEPETGDGMVTLELPFPLIPVSPLPPIALLEPSPLPGGNPNRVSDLISLNFVGNRLVVTLVSDGDNAHPLELPAGSLTFLETGKPQDVFKFDSAFTAPVHVWVQSDVEPIPEPDTVSLMLAGVAALAAWGWMRKRA